MYPMSWTVSVG